MSEQKLASKTIIHALAATTDPKKLCTSNPTRKLIAVHTSGNDVAYITSAQNNPYTEGVKVTATVPYENTTTTAELWIIASSGSNACIVQEDTD